ncbi:MAG: hypothetical protein QM680_01010 [Luteolibacter sp.]
MTLTDLPYTDGRHIPASYFSSAAQGMRRLTKTAAITTATDYGAINAWYGDDGLWHGITCRFHQHIDEFESRSKEDIRDWLRRALIWAEGGQEHIEPRCYAVVACRWGWENNGFSILLVTTDLAQAIRKADDYADHRGGKYGVGVFDGEGKQVHHAASSYREKSIHRNHRMDTFELVGGEVVCAFETGRKPDMKEARRLWEQGVAVEKAHAENELT